jgi:hypothetical protein
MMAQSLLKAGADISIQDYKEKTVDDWAKEIKKEDEWKAALAAARNKTSKKLPPVSSGESLTTRHVQLTFGHSFRTSYE